MSMFEKNAVTVGTILASAGVMVFNKFLGDHAFTVDEAAVLIPAVALIIRSIQGWAKWKGIIPSLFIFLALSSTNAYAEDEGLARIVISHKPVLTEVLDYDSSGNETGFTFTTTTAQPELYFAPMVTVSLLVINLERREEYRAGIVPGIGYGFHWSPAWYSDKDAPFISAGVFLQGGLRLNVSSVDGVESADYAVFSVLPTVTVLRWFSVGVGWEQRISLTPGIEDNGAPILALGIASAF